VAEYEKAEMSMWEMWGGRDIHSKWMEIRAGWKEAYLRAGVGGWWGWRKDCLAWGYTMPPLTTSEVAVLVDYYIAPIGDGVPARERVAQIQAWMTTGELVEQP
jgi:hypothetical protein